MGYLPYTIVCIRKQHQLPQYIMDVANSLSLLYMMHLGLAQQHWLTATLVKRHPIINRHGVTLRLLIGRNHSRFFQCAGWWWIGWSSRKEWSAIGQTPMSIPRPSKGLCKCLHCCHTFITSSFIAHTGFTRVHACHACHVAHAAGFGVTAAEDTTRAIFHCIIHLFITCVLQTWYHLQFCSSCKSNTGIHLRYPNNTSRSPTVKVFPTDRTKDMDYAALSLIDVGSRHIR